MSVRGAGPRPTQEKSIPNAPSASTAERSKPSFLDDLKGTVQSGFDRVELAALDIAVHTFEGANSLLKTLSEPSSPGPSLAERFGNIADAASMAASAVPLAAEVGARHLSGNSQDTRTLVALGVLGFGIDASVTRSGFRGTGIAAFILGLGGDRSE